MKAEVERVAREHVTKEHVIRWWRHVEHIADVTAETQIFQRHSVTALSSHYCTINITASRPRIMSLTNAGLMSELINISLPGRA